MHLFWMFLCFIPPMLLAMWAQFRVKSAFKRYNKIGNASGLSGAEAAAKMLQGMGLRVVGSAEEAQSLDNAVAISMTRGFLSDHYDPRAKELRLSPKVYEGRSLASVGVACHEAGHAMQHAQNYAPLETRTFMVPVASFGSWAAFPILLAGFFFQIMPFAWLGILLFATLVFFQVVTLPVEFNASNRAKQALWDLNIIRGQDEREGVAAMLSAAALTYVAATVSSIGMLLYYLMIITGGNR